jgi:uncharacterized integral membrane protein (TIGR00697 family)
MIKNNYLLIFLVILHISIITLSNILVSIPIEIYGLKITWAAFSFPLVVVATDLTIRLLGKSTAQKTITFSFPFAIISSILILYLEENPLSVSLRIGIASGTAYAIGILIDIYAFQFIREKYASWWIAPALSTIISNIIDSYTFFFCCFLQFRRPIHDNKLVRNCWNSNPIKNNYRSYIFSSYIWNTS